MSCFCFFSIFSKLEKFIPGNQELVWMIHVLYIHDIGPILDNRLKETFLKPWKGVLSIYVCVCLSMCVRAT